MKKPLSWMYKLILTLVIAIFLFLIVIATTVQTQWGKDKALIFIKTLAEKNEMIVSIGKLDGTLPFEYELQNIQIQITPNKKVIIGSLKCQIEIFPLLKRQISFSYLEANEISFEETKTESVEKKIIPNQPYWIDVPIALKCKSFSLTNLHLPIADDIFWDLNLKGRGKIKKHGKKITLKILATRKGFDNTDVTLRCLATKKDRSLSTQLQIQTDTIKAFAPLVPTSIDIAGNIQIDTKGALDTYLDILKSNENIQKQQSIVAHAKGELTFVDYPMLKKSQLVSDFSIYSDLSVVLTNILLQSDLGKISGHARFAKNFLLDKASIELKGYDLSLLDIPFLDMKGSMQAHLSASIKDSKHAFEIKYSMKDLIIKNHPIEFFAGSMMGNYDQKKLLGKVFLKSKIAHHLMEGSSDLSWEKDQNLHFANILLTLPSSKLIGEFSITPRFHFIGNLDFASDTFRDLRLIYPTLDLVSHANMKATFNEKLFDNKYFQQAKISGKLENLRYSELFLETAHLDLEIDDFEKNPFDTLLIQGKKVRFRHLHLDNFYIKTDTKSDNWPFEIKCFGMWKEPVDLLTKGFWRWQNRDLTLNIQEFQGHTLSYPFSIPKPIQIQWTKEKLLVEEAELNMPSSSLFANVDLSKEQADVRLVLDHFPLDFFSFNPLELSISGFTSAEAFLTSKDHEVSSNINLSVDKMQIFALGDEKPLEIDGKLLAKIEKDQLQTSGQASMQKKKILEFNASLPVSLQLYPFKLSIIDNEPITSDLTYNGKIEEILDFFDTGYHRLEGDLNAHFIASNTWAHPLVDGSATLTKGIYENYYTGTFLQNISLNLKSDNDKILLQSFSATDDKKGKISANGSFAILPEKDFPFSLDLTFSDLHLAKTDFISAYGKGSLELTGTKKVATAKGNLFINKTNLTIPDKLPYNIPNLSIQYINKPEEEIPQKLTSPIYPVHLDLQIDTSDQIFIKGRGLDSRWKGHFKIGGTYGNLITKGDLDLIDGSYNFSGKKFTLTHGDLRFLGKEKELPNLSLTGEITQKGVTIIAILAGPLNSPDLNFTSKPPLPLSSIVSLLLFGQDVSEISGTQAEQLVNTIAGFATGPGTLEGSSGSLGIDRVALVPSTTKDDPDQSALQVGKYVTKGVMVSLSQGTDQGSSNVIVEVDLTHGFVFQAESQQQQEQGKFTIKWVHNY